MAQHLLAAADRFQLLRLRCICEQRLCETVEVGAGARRERRGGLPWQRAAGGSPFTCGLRPCWSRPLPDAALLEPRPCRCCPPA